MMNYGAAGGASGSRAASAGGGRRHSGRRPGRPDTRQEILAAARALFAESGYSSVTMRAVAEAAGVDSALVHHYFGTKDGLFRAALEIPVDPAQVMAGIVEGGLDGAPERMLGAILKVWDGPQTGPAMVAAFRTLLADPVSTESIRDVMVVKLLRLAAAGLLPEIDREAAQERIALVLSQLLGLVVLRRVLQIEPLASMEVEQVVAAVAPTIERYLRAGAAAPAQTQSKVSERVTADGDVVPATEAGSEKA